MFVSKKKNILFFHIPKTAGTSIHNYLYAECADGAFFTNLMFEKFLKRYDGKFNFFKQSQIYQLPEFKHLSQRQGSLILEELNLNVKNFIEFVVVRNPYDRLISYYNFILHKDYSNMHKLLDDIESNTVDPVLHYRTQLEYIKNPLTNNLRIFKYERLDECEVFLQDMLGTNQMLPKLNVTTNSFIEGLDKGIKDRVYTIFREEFDLLGYSK